MGRARSTVAWALGFRARVGLLVVAAAGIGTPAAVADERALTLGLAGGGTDPWAVDLDSTSAPHLGLGALPGLPAPSAPTGDGFHAATDPAATTAPRSSPAMPSVAGYPRHVWKDFTVLATRPLNFDSHDWTTLALGTGLVAVAAGFDTRVRDSLQAHSSASTHSFANRIRPIGTWGGLAAMGVLFGAGEMSGNANLAATGADGIEATLFSAGIIAPVLKEVVGRSRPTSGGDSDTGRLFSGGQSFPSGEATEAFALAAVVSSHTDSLPLQGLSWGLAGLVGWERMQLDAHWASDVVAGALLGIVVGRWVSDRGRVEASGDLRFAIQPAVGPRTVGLNATLSW
jgi:membrane-associated phospholipid phosphatase